MLSWWGFRDFGIPKAQPDKGLRIALRRDFAETGEKFGDTMTDFSSKIAQ